MMSGFFLLPNFINYLGVPYGRVFRFIVCKAVALQKDATATANANQFSAALFLKHFIIFTIKLLLLRL